MAELTPALLAIAATLAVAAIAAFWKILNYTLDLDRRQDELRHELRNEMSSRVIEVESRLTTRLDRLENTSVGYRQSRWYRNNGNHHD